MQTNITAHINLSYHFESITILFLPSLKSYEIHYNIFLSCLISCKNLYIKTEKVFPPQPSFSEMHDSRALRWASIQLQTLFTYQRIFICNSCGLIFTLSPINLCMSSNFSDLSSWRVPTNENAVYTRHVVARFGFSVPVQSLTGIANKHATWSKSLWILTRDLYDK